MRQTANRNLPGSYSLWSAYILKLLIINIPPLSKAKIFKGDIPEEGAWHCSQKTDKISVILPESANNR